MTREERIKSALLPILEKMREHGATDEMCKMYDNGFHVGAMWADAHPHWISVEDELPKEGITYYSEPVIVTDGTIVGIDMYNHQAGEWDEVKKPTHWMPLPQPPKGGDKE